MFSARVETLLRHKRDLYLFAEQMEHWVHYQAFLRMVRYIDTRAFQEIEEVATFPMELTRLIGALRGHIGKHVNPKKANRYERLLNPELLGTKEDFIRWQEFGYFLPDRSARTYEQRLRVWRYLYNNDPMQVIETVKQRNRILTIEEAPYWLVWNYGSHSIHQRAGFPNVTGMHFLEYGVASIEPIRRAALRIAERTLTSFVQTGSFELPDILRDAEWQKAFTDFQGAVG